MNFSNRTDWDLRENDFTLAVHEAKSSGRELVDLTIANPTACGFKYDSEKILLPLSSAAALRYEPAAFGMVPAREAVQTYYTQHNAAVEIQNICLTTSTSEAYSFLFRLLCDPGDEVLIATPSYPLFDFLAQLDDVTLRTYSLVYDEDWQIDFHALESAITTRTKAVIVVHPNNPTGNYASGAERAALDELCARNDLALIVDEVFLDYAVGEQRETFTSGMPAALTFVLSGISKVCALPQMKLSWIAANGPRSLVRSAMERLEIIADTFLSVNAPTQYALPFWLADRFHIQQQVRERVGQNIASLTALLHGSHADVLSLQGGWTAVLRVPRYVDEMPFAEAALSCGVIVQPGEFFGLNNGHVVLSLLPTPEAWQRGISSLPIR